MKRILLCFVLCITLLATGCSKSSKSNGLDAKKLYSLKTPYIGDNSAVNAIMDALDIPKGCGDYEISLQTDKEPYYFTIQFKSIWKDADIPQLKQDMINRAMIALSLIDNAGAVAFTYNYMGETEEMLSVITVTTATATSIIGNDIKSFSESADKMQDLLDLLAKSNISTSEE